MSSYAAETIQLFWIIQKQHARFSTPTKSILVFVGLPGLYFADLLGAEEQCFRLMAHSIKKSKMSGVLSGGGFSYTIRFHVLFQIPTFPKKS